MYISLKNKIRRKKKWRKIRRENGLEKLYSIYTKGGQQRATFENWRWKTRSRVARQARWKPKPDAAGIKDAREHRGTLINKDRVFGKTKKKRAAFERIAREKSSLLEVCQFLSKLLFLFFFLLPWELIQKSLLLLTKLRFLRWIYSDYKYSEFTFQICWKSSLLRRTIHKPSKDV